MGGGHVVPDPTAEGGTWSVSQMATSFSGLGCTWGAKARPKCFLSPSRVVDPSTRGCAPQ